MWGDEEYFGLGYEFDPVWFLSDEDRALEREIIDACQRRDPAAGDRVLTGRGAYPRASVDEIGPAAAAGDDRPAGVRLPGVQPHHRC